MMKNGLKFLAIIFGLGFALTMSSCSDDDSGIDLGDDDGLKVANGFYPKKVDEDPKANAQLVSTVVSGPDFGTLERDGFVQAFVYLTAGDYNLVEVKDGAIVATLGGTSIKVEGTDGTDGTANINMECDPDASYFTAVTDLAEGGDTFNVPKDGLYVIGYDQQSKEVIYDEMVSVGIIGAATKGGWSTDTELSGSFTPAGGTWTVDDEALEEGEWKIRFNCRWDMDRRLDPFATFSNDNGYTMFTNFGGIDGSASNLAIGNVGTNINNGERGKYTISVVWDPISGFSATATKTGDLDPLPEFPEAMYLVGAGSAYGWDTPGSNDDAIMHKIAGSNPGVYWKIASLTANTGFKLSAAEWKDPNLGLSGVTVDSEGLAVSDDGDGNMAVANDGVYMIVLDLREEGVSKLSITNAMVYGIGDAFDGGDYTEDNPDALFSIDVEDKTVTSPALSGDGDIRIYAHHPWIPDWWNAEFVPINGVIEYRNDGGDQERVAGTTGQKVILSFDDNTAAIK